MLSDVKKIVYDKIGTFIVASVIGLLTYQFIDKQKQDYAFESALALKYIDYQLKTYQSANRVIYLANISSSILLETQGDKKKFLNLMNEFENTREKLFIEKENFELLLVSYNIFITNSTKEKVYIPILENIENYFQELNHISRKYKDGLYAYEKSIEVTKRYKSIFLKDLENLKSYRKYISKID